MKFPNATIMLTLILGAAYSSGEVEAGDWHWHQVSRYGTFDPRYEDVWEDLDEDVYGERKLDDLYADPHDLFDLGQGYWACPGCQYLPQPYSSFREEVGNDRAPYAGSSWYRGIPVGVRTKKPLSSPADRMERPIASRDFLRESGLFKSTSKISFIQATSREPYKAPKRQTLKLSILFRKKKQVFLLLFQDMSTI